jgi:uncharacterized membrane protein YdjX (TVP38/TMEM64 family)
VISSTPDADVPARTAAPTGLRRAWPLALMLAAIAAFWALGLNRFISLDTVAEHRLALLGFVAAHGLVAAITFVAIYTAAVAVSFPGAALLTVAGGFLFGTLAGGALSIVGATAGATLIFLVARTSLGEGLGRRAGPFLEGFEAGFRRDAFLYLLSLRLAPIFPFWLVNLAPALVGVRLRDHFASTVLGIIPGTFAFAAVGAGLDSLLLIQHETYRACLAAGQRGCTATLDPNALLTPKILLAFFALAALSLVPVAVKALRGRRG